MLQYREHVFNPWAGTRFYAAWYMHIYLLIFVLEVGLATVKLNISKLQKVCTLTLDRELAQNEMCQSNENPLVVNVAARAPHSLSEYVP